MNIEGPISEMHRIITKRHKSIIMLVCIKQKHINYDTKGIQNFHKLLKNYLGWIEKPMICLYYLEAVQFFQVYKDGIL